jgi:hypothetical protein
VAFDALKEHVTTKPKLGSDDYQLLAVAVIPNLKNARTAEIMLKSILDFWHWVGLRHDALAWMFGRNSVGPGEL